MITLPSLQLILDIVMDFKVVLTVACWISGLLRCPFHEFHNALKTAAESARSPHTAHCIYTPSISYALNHLHRHFGSPGYASMQD